MGFCLDRVHMIHLTLQLQAGCLKIKRCEDFFSTHYSKICSSFLEVPASLPCLRTMCIGNTTVWSMALGVHESWGSAAAVVQSPCLQNEGEVDYQGSGASLDFFSCTSFFFPQRWFGSCSPTVLRSTLLVWLEPWPVVVIATQKGEIA